MEEKQTQENQVEMAGIPVKTRIRVGPSGSGGGRRNYTREECQVSCQGEPYYDYCVSDCQTKPKY